MIDLGLAKLALIGVVALIVIGPEKLPRVARMAGSLIGRAQRYLNQVKAEVSRDMELDELRKIQQGVEQTATGLKSSVAKEITTARQNVNSIWQHSGSDAAAPSISSIPKHVNRASNSLHKAREFRRKKLARNSALPGWYKHQQGSKTRLLSAAARVAKYRAAGKSSLHSFY